MISCRFGHVNSLASFDRIEEFKIIDACFNKRTNKIACNEAHTHVRAERQEILHSDELLPPPFGCSRSRHSFYPLQSAKLDHEFRESGILPHIVRVVIAEANMRIVHL